MPLLFSRLLAGDLYVNNSQSSYSAIVVRDDSDIAQLASWITGWSNWLGQVTGAPSVNYGTAAMILAAASINSPSYVPTNYQVGRSRNTILLS